MTKLTEKKRPPIENKVKLKLWIKSGGRCQYRNCNQILFEDSLTFKDLNKSYIAHIYGYAPNSARYDAVLSPKLEVDFSNLMLMCDSCHRKIDRDEKDVHPASLLIEMKKEHEDRIEYMTGIMENVRTNMVLYNAKIGKFNPPMEIDLIRKLLANKNKYPHKTPIVLGPESTVIEDNEGLYWEYESKSLEVFFEKNLEPLLKSTENHFSLFPFAPMPLLIKLGVLLGDKHPVVTYQYHREPQGWEWSDTSDFDDFKLIEPDVVTGIPILIISLSANIDDARVKELFLGQEISIWRLSIENPRLDFLKTEEILSKFRRISRSTFGRIKDVHGHDNKLHVFPAMPLSSAVEFGRVWMPKVDLPMVLYDGREKFMKTIEIKRN